MKYTTPLRYPGGKSRAIKFLSQHLPKIESYREPFLGGGSMALYVTQTYPNTDVWVNDLYYPLYAFWMTLRDHGQELCDDLRELKTELGESYDAHKRAFDDAKDKLNNDLYESGFNFYVANKCSFSGLTANSSFSKQASRANFTFRGIDKLPALSELIQGWRITNQSYEVIVIWQKCFCISRSTICY